MKATFFALAAVAMLQSPVAGSIVMPASADGLPSFSRGDGVRLAELPAPLPRRRTDPGIPYLVGMESAVVAGAVAACATPGTIGADPCAFDAVRFRTGR